MKVLKLSMVAIAIAVTGCTAYAQTADEVIQKHIDAVGGCNAWDKIKSVKLTGSINQGGMELTMAQTIVNDKGSRTDISAMGQNGYMIITPTEGWMYMPFGGQTKPEPIPMDQLKSQQDKLNFKNSQLVDKGHIAKSSLEGRDTINKTPCFKLKITDKDGSEQTCFIDAKTYYLVRTEMKMNLQGDEQELSITYSDFKKQPEGITVPMTYGTAQGELKFKSIEINKTYSDGLFKPAASDGKN